MLVIGTLAEEGERFAGKDKVEDLEATRLCAPLSNEMLYNWFSDHTFGDANHDDSVLHGKGRRERFPHVS